MKLVGRAYLRDTLLPVLAELTAGDPNCEIDPARLPKTESREANISQLIYYINKCIIALVSSAAMCPAPMRRLFAQIQRCAVEQFPDTEGIRHTAVSGFVFLRFFAPAILVCLPRLISCLFVCRWF